ncbi:hypothetical protein HK102_004277, partial [Quaeritorhiza haematococci]
PNTTFPLKRTFTVLPPANITKTRPFSSSRPLMSPDQYPFPSRPPSLTPLTKTVISVGAGVLAFTFMKPIVYTILGVAFGYGAYRLTRNWLDRRYDTDYGSHPGAAVMKMMDQARRHGVPPPIAMMRDMMRAVQQQQQRMQQFNPGVQERWGSGTTYDQLHRESVDYVREFAENDFGFQQFLAAESRRGGLSGDTMGRITFDRPHYVVSSSTGQFFGGSGTKTSTVEIGFRGTHQITGKRFEVLSSARQVSKKGGLLDDITVVVTDPVTGRSWTVVSGGKFKGDGRGGSKFSRRPDDIPDAEFVDVNDRKGR